MKKKLLICSFALAVAFSVAILPGCATAKLDPAGVYGAQTNGATIIKADLTITSSYHTLDAFLDWEKKNRAYLLANAPQVVSEAKEVRANLEKWVASATVLRDAYVLNASASNATALATSLAVITSAASQSTNYIH